jgi:hypothetical protein
MTEFYIIYDKKIKRWIIFFSKILNQLKTRILYFNFFAGCNFLQTYHNNDNYYNQLNSTK